MNSVRLGIIGCGFIGRMHAVAASRDPNVDLVAFADVDRDRARALANEFGARKVYKSPARMLANPDIDAVVLALTASVRSKLAPQVLRKGKHLLIEKPPAINARQIRKLMELQGDRVVGCCSARFSFFDGARIAREIVDSGALGALRVVRCRGLSAVSAATVDWTPPPWRVSHALNGGGYLVNWGIYDLDYLMHVTGWQLIPETVLAQTWPITDDLREGRVHPDSDAENHVIVMIRCTNGAVLTLERGEAVSIPDEDVWQVTGERGSLRLQMTPSRGPIVLHDHADPETGLQSTVALEDSGPDVQHTMPVSDFAAAIREGRQPQTDLTKALALQTILDAIYKSARSGQSVRVRRT
jgi:UDP-N-acetyl-2-amino-2-deoxyglucuronate dehydrogenase